MIDGQGHRKFIIPAEVKGFYHRRKKYLHFVLLGIFLGLPWLQVNGEQAILLNVAARKFTFFGLSLRAHDAPLIFFVLLGLVSGLALMTALFGRVWCGWACPQTVFIERIFRQIEIWVEGNYIQRRKLQEAELNFQKFCKVGLKWMLYFALSFLISHSFLAYWVGSENLLKMMGASPKENFFYFVMVGAMTGLVLFNFGWFREQFCLIVCPYGKFQSVLLDSHSLNVMYDEKRGEPRKGASPEKLDAKGDCVSCQRCVQVCPTGIDIRNGVQMECIGCTACIDACNEIMQKVKKPMGLIRYKAATSGRVNWFRPRIIIYLSVFLCAVVGLMFFLDRSSNLRIEVLRAPDLPYQLRQDQGISIVQNHYILRIENSGSQVKKLRVENPQADLKMIIPENPVFVAGGKKKEIPLFLEISQTNLRRNSGHFLLLIKEAEGTEIKEIRIEVVGPR